MTAEIVSRLTDSFAIEDYDSFPGFSAEETVANMIEELQASKKRINDLFDLTSAQARTIQAQSDALNSQSETMKAQARVINKITAEQFYDYALAQLGDVPEDDLVNQRSILNTAMEKAAKLFDFEWERPGQERDE